MEDRFDHHSDTDLVAVIGAVLDALTDDRLRLPTDEQRLELLTQAVSAHSRLSAWLQHLTATIDADQITLRASGTPTVTWLADASRLTRGEAGRLVKAGKGLAKFHQIGQAALSGEVLAQQAEAITSVLADLPDDLDADQIAAGERHMCELADTHTSAELRLLARHLVEVLDPDTAEAREEERQEHDRKRAMAGRGLFFSDDGHGSTTIKGSLPTTDAAILQKVIDAQAAQVRRGIEAADPLLPVPSLPQRRADALLWMVQHILACQAAPVHGGDRPRIGVTISYETLLQYAREAGYSTTDAEGCAVPHSGGNSAPKDSAEPHSSESEWAESAWAEPDWAEPHSAESQWTIRDGAGSGWAEPRTPPETLCGDGWSPGVGTNTSTGQPVPASVLRQWLCDADILPIVLGGPSEILDVGRAHRLVTDSIRTGLVQRDQGCVFPGCVVPPEACHAHHIKPWVCGGDTALINLALLCPHHHNIVEPSRDPAADRWTLRLRPDGVSEIRPPRRVDKTQKPRIHARFLTIRRT